MPHPSDPLYDAQWHLALIGDMPTVWDDYTGARVSVGIYDSAIQYAHPELAANYDATKHLVFEGTVYDAAYTGPAKDGNPHGTEHGTHVAGVIAAALDGKGSVGVAPGASLTGFDIFNPATPLYVNMGTLTGLYAALAQGALLDVVNNSWSFRSSFYYSHNVIRPDTVDFQIAGIWEDLAENGRGGLGTIVVKGAGNDYWNAQSIGLNVSRHAVVVGSVTEDGLTADYSNHGANVLVSAPAGYNMVTVDILGEEGWNWNGGGDNDYTNQFGGTSGAAPVVSGVAALMLEANENLGWRDVRDILTLSATHTGSAIGAASTGFENGTWVVNGADSWNGGGLHYHVNYGYGVVNGYNAVRMAEAWGLFGAPRTSTNESFVDLSGKANLAITEQPAIYTLSLTSDLVVEQVDVTLRFVNSTFPVLSAELIAPDGSVHPLLYYDTPSITYADVIWRFSVEGLRNVAAEGDWSIRVSRVGGPSGQLTDVQFRIHGRAEGADDVYHFTDEFSAMAALDPARRLVDDGDAGLDWLNMAAVRGDIRLDLREGAFSTLEGGQFIEIAAGTVIENAVTGDGDDVIFGNSADNALHGGRGNDIYYVNGAGDGAFEKAGQGTDLVAANIDYTLAAGSAVETLRTTANGGLTALDLTGNRLAQTIIGNAGDNVLHDGGKGAADVMKGLGGNDVYRVFNAADLIAEGAAQGEADRVMAAIDYRLGAGVHVERLTTNGSAGTAAIDLTGNGFAQEIVGNAGDNVLTDGAGAADHLRGLSGNDTYRIYTSGTTIVEGAAQGASDKVAAAVDYALAAGVHVEAMSTLSAGGTAAVKLTGNELAQAITGNAGDNVLGDGGGAGDVLSGFLGDDTYIVRSAATTIVEVAGRGTDRVATAVDYVLGAGADVEVMTTISAAGHAAIDLTGNELGQRIYGNAGENRLEGQGGTDRLSGLGGADSFVFASALGPDNVDTITDFGVGEDVLLLSASIFAALAQGALAAAAFLANATGLAGDADDRIVYRTDTGSIFYDADGTGTAAGIHFATITAGLALTSADFSVV
jgi:Ca2+-binding RTX toxin-like protein